MQDDREGLPGIILAGKGLLVKKHYNSWTEWYILIKFCILIHFNIIDTHVWKTVIWLRQDFFCGKA